MTIAEFLAYRIVGGHLAFARVPASLKPAVKTALEQSGCGHLATE